MKVGDLMTPDVRVTAVKLQHFRQSYCNFTVLVTGGSQTASRHQPDLGAGELLVGVLGIIQKMPVPIERHLYAGMSEQGL